MDELFCPMPSLASGDAFERLTNGDYIYDSFSPLSTSVKKMYLLIFMFRTVIPYPLLGI